FLMTMIPPPVKNSDKCNLNGLAVNLPDRDVKRPRRSGTPGPWRCSGRPRRQKGIFALVADAASAGISCSMADSLDIAEVARLTGLTVRALRFYEARGLVRPLRTASGRRHYGPVELERLHQVIAMKRT